MARAAMVTGTVMSQEGGDVRKTTSFRRIGRRSVGLLIATVILTAPAVVLASHQFPDVPNGHPFHSQIDAIAEAGITAGFPDGGYHPSEAVTRQAMAAFMHRGFGRAGFAANITPMTTQIDAAINVNQTTAWTPVRQLTITVPGQTNSFSPQQVVLLRGRVIFYGKLRPSVEGCPCEFEATIRDTTTSLAGVVQRQTFETASTIDHSYAFDVDGIFLAPPGARTYRLEVRLYWREGDDAVGSFFPDSSTSLSAMTFPFGPTGANTL